MRATSMCVVVEEHPQEDRAFDESAKNDKSAHVKREDALVGITRRPLHDVVVGWRNAQRQRGRPSLARLM